MGRRFPVDENQIVHPLASLYLLIACIAATMAIVSSLCGEKKETDSDPKQAENSQVINPPNGNATSTDLSMPGDIESPPSNHGEGGEKPLPLPPARAMSFNMRSSSSLSQGKLLSSMSMKIQGGGKDNDHEKEKKKQKKLKHEDSILHKPIILGGKNKVPKEDGDDRIYYDEKENLSLS